MTEDEIIKAAHLIDMKRKLEDFMEQAPHDADLLTITFRKDKASKSVSLRDEPSIVNIRTMVGDVYDDVVQAIADMGVEYDD